MATKNKAGQGRPNKFGTAEVRAMRAIVREHGLVKGAAVINERGLMVAGKGGQVHRDVTVCLPTLSKYVQSEIGGKPLALKRGRPKGYSPKAAAAAKAAAKVSKSKKAA